MITKLKSKIAYDGIDMPLVIPEEVEIIGVLFPVNPGMLAIVNNGNLQEVPAHALQFCPDLDFDAMLTEKQIKERDTFGGLIGAGLCVVNRTLLPLEQCKLKRAKL